MGFEKEFKELINETILITRYGKAKLVNGKNRYSVDKEFKAKVVIQPISGKQRELLPEGQRTKELYVVYSEMEIRQDDDTKQEKADVVKYGRYLYEAISSEAHLGASMQHYKTIIAKINNQKTSTAR